jgi:ABC-type proline/glycine betaine transport system permease subunit
MTIIQDLTTIIIGTGTTGGMIMTGDGIITGINNLSLVGIIITTIIALLLDRRLNQNLDKYPDQEQFQELSQNQEKIEEE